MQTLSLTSPTPNIDFPAQTCGSLTLVTFGQRVPSVELGCGRVPFAVDAVGVVIVVVVEAGFGVLL